MTARRRAAAVPAAVCAALLAGCGTGPADPQAVRAPAPSSAGPTPGPPAPVRATPQATATAARNRPLVRTPPGPTARPAPARSGPDLSRTTAPPRRTTPEAPHPAPTAGDSTARTGSARRPRVTTLRIGSWSAKVVRGGQEAVDACRDAVQWAGPDLGTEDGYKMRTAVVVGHDFCGFQQFATLPVGTVATVETPRQVLRYKVYARYLTPGRGAPAHGLYWGDLTLQSCVGPDTGFTYLMRE
ncbi:hypothetical protein ACFVYE_16935 [Streptomyces sp. NPDC058239]|uniref:hypothetical protein n=1 Tax=Streptomyces sp. NPDC058239 TaxID=3346395 RepID=UPI0036E4E62D